MVVLVVHHQLQGFQLHMLEVVEEEHQLQAQVQQD
jgi:hypothetical protein